MASAIKVRRVDSPKNCLIRSDFRAPTTFRIPTSLARVECRAVDRFMKLTQARSRMQKAVKEKM